MPTKRVHLKFDEYLKEHGIISEGILAGKVHERMDKDLMTWGAEHREIDFYHSEDGVRDWLRGFSHLAYQETLTDYLRVALGHLVLDDVSSRFQQSGVEEIVKSAYRSFVQRGFHKKYLRKNRIHRSLVLKCPEKSKLIDPAPILFGLRFIALL